MIERFSDEFVFAVCWLYVQDWLTLRLDKNHVQYASAFKDECVESDAKL